MGTKVIVRDAIHTHFVKLIGKCTISFLPTHSVFLLALSRDVTKLLYFNLPTLPRLSARCLTHPPTIVNLPISLTKWVWIASLPPWNAHLQNTDSFSYSKKYPSWKILLCFPITRIDNLDFHNVIMNLLIYGSKAYNSYVLGVIHTDVATSKFV